MAKLIKVASRTPKKPKLLIEERRRRILDMLNSQERVTVSDLVEAFGISAVPFGVTWMRWTSREDWCAPTAGL